jgi:hypothetical protein
MKLSDKNKIINNEVIDESNIDSIITKDIYEK